MRSIAAMLGISPSTVCREIKRNSPHNTQLYRASFTQTLATRRLSQAHRRRRLKRNRLRLYIEARLKQRWSPEIIAGRLNAKLKKKIISHEAIYQWIYAEEPELIDWLTRAHKKRRKRAGYKKRGFVIPNRTPIALRDQEANIRGDFGHLEADTIVSGKSSSCICASIDRKTRIVRLLKIKKCGAQEMSRSY